MTQIKETTRQNILEVNNKTLKGHVSLNWDDKTFRYDIDRNIPIILVGVQPCERLREEISKAEEKGLGGIRIGIRGGDTFILDRSNFDRMDYYIRIFEEITEDLKSIKEDLVAKGFTAFMPTDGSIEDKLEEEIAKQEKEQTKEQTEKLNEAEETAKKKSKATKANKKA